MKMIFSGVMSWLMLLSFPHVQAQNRVLDAVTGAGLAGVTVTGTQFFHPTSPGSPPCIYTGQSISDAGGSFSVICNGNSTGDFRCPPFFFPCAFFSFAKPDFRFFQAGFSLNNTPDQNITSYFGTDRPETVIVNAADYHKGQLAPGMIVSAFGGNLAATTATATTTPLPTTLAGIKVNLLDRLGLEKPASLFFISPTQINFVVPDGLLAGPTVIKFAQNDEITHITFQNLELTSPHLFTVDASGNGLAAGIILRIKANGEQNYEPLAHYDTAQNRIVAAPIDLSEVNDQVILLLFGTGWRNRTSLANCAATVGLTPVELLYAGPQNTLEGLDQCNIRLPHSLAERGNVIVQVRVADNITNAVTVSIR